ncbi:MAG: hypothetical protein IJI14_06740 [Anaerolineaceae bacterium]|nr:hypothetical protein [Anaerolineaceae bacterium]
MGYTALEKMRRLNRETFGMDLGPMQPDLTGIEGNDLKSAALRFLHERCEGLFFNDSIAAEEEKQHVFRGKSLKTGQIPYNMQRDINRLCLARELSRFIESGSADDAYTVYYCYFEMVFGEFGKSKKMIELLSEFESNGSSLLMKHRDHYSHSVYVFTLGLAIYETNSNFRAAFKHFYHISTDENDKEADRTAAHKFLKLWGMTALFHDIGYPFELPFEQVMSYFEVAGLKRGSENPWLTYTNMDSMIRFGNDEKEHFRKLYGKTFESLEELYAHVVTLYLGEEYSFSEGHIFGVIHQKPLSPEIFSFYIDHAYFSSVRLYRELVNSKPGVSVVSKEYVDCLTAILLHNSLFKMAVAFYKSKDPTVHKPPLPMESFPLAFLLFLCDELQCWDRTAYGRNSRHEMHPVSADFDLSGNELRVKFFYDEAEQEKIEDFMAEYELWEKNGEEGDPPRLKEYSDMAVKEQRFAREIELIVDTSEIPLQVSAGLIKPDRRSKRVYLSASSFLHLYDFAVALNGRYSYHGMEKGIPTEELEAEFEKLSLEYQLSNIEQAKSFGHKLDALNCFYTDKPVDYDMLTAFTTEQTEVIAPLEHERWIREKESMGWRFGNAYKALDLSRLPCKSTGIEKNDRKMLRELFRMHELAMEGHPTEEEIRAHYHNLAGSEQEKDIRPFNSMLELIKKFDGLRIYQLPG